MAQPTLAVFKYQHADRVGSSPATLAFCVAFVGLLALALYWQNPFGFFLVFIAIVLGIARWPKRRISLGPRYMLCGNTLIYYGNVQRMVLVPGRELLLQWGENSFKLERDRFPTNARKTPKIEKNKTAKFEKVSGKIIERVTQAAPHAKLERRKGSK